jgi:DNA polymerase-3 subunit beta
VHLARPAKGNTLAFLTDGGTVVVRLIDSQFPDYERFIPRSPAESATVAASALIDAIKVVRPFSRDNANILRLHATPESTLRLTCRDEAGDGVIDLPAEATGETQVAVNASYLLDAVAPFAGGDVILGIDGASLPILLTAKESPTRTVVMAMNVNDPVPTPKREAVPA